MAKLTPLHEALTQALIQGGFGQGAHPDIGQLQITLRALRDEGYFVVNEETLLAITAQAAQEHLGCACDGLTGHLRMAIAERVGRKA